MKDYDYVEFKYVLLEDGSIVIPTHWVDMHHPDNKPHMKDVLTYQEVSFEYRRIDKIRLGRKRAWVYAKDIVAKGDSVCKLKRIHKRRRRAQKKWAE